MRFTSVVVALGILTLFGFPTPVTPQSVPSVNTTIFRPVTKWSDIPPSGDVVPRCLPKSTASKPYSGKKVAIVLANAAEEIEVTFSYQYFADRGASIDFLCSGAQDSNAVYIHDFTRPNSSVTCATNVPATYTYDAVVIVGWIPSSSVVRDDSDRMGKILQWLQTDSSSSSPRLLAVICSGIETLLKSRIIDLLQAQVTQGTKMPLTGSPASAVPVQNYLNFNGTWGDASKSYGTNPTAWYTVPGTTNKVVLGQNPDALQAWVANISSFWLNTTEDPYNVTTCSGGVPLAPNVSVFNPVSDQTVLPRGNQQGAQLVNTSLPCLNTDNRNFCQDYTKVGILLGQGPHDSQVISLYQIFQSNGMRPKFICPDWIVGSNKSVYLQEDNAVYTTYSVKCDLATSLAKSQEWDYLLIPGGLFSTHATLRVDSAAVGLLGTAELVGLSDTAVGLLALASTAAAQNGGKQLPSTRYNDFDLSMARWEIAPSKSYATTETFTSTASSSTCTTCNLALQSVLLAQTRILNDYKPTSVDFIIIPIAIVLAGILVAVLSAVFKSRASPYQQVAVYDTV